MGQYKCMICDDKIACRAIDEELAKGLSGEALARLMTLRGFSVTAPTILSHAKHRVPIPPPGVAKKKRDLALLVRDKVAERIENAEGDDEAMDSLLFSKGGQGAISVGLKAEAIIDKREARVDDKQTVLKLALLLAGGGQLLAPPELIEDGMTIEGEAREVG